jgi:preprotein translocase SecE subunit
LAGVALELRKTAWPTCESTLWNGFIVLAVLVASATLIAGLDAAFANTVASFMH